ncbi:HlyD family secretion protein [Propionicimonas sp.]|uniref:HlyD family secretion protein n=1 Tax=Propionicimonas sp. TaxID=1955623 RepID=UPI00178EF4EB|nr:HlyD family secretion protein [Propionicimonas sp.]MBU3977844.1 HlyD family efflux transporter periplasmic adaptor subunit [Actinomycetota bacterium]MBA3021932.1 HlyD family efflux transporter periplasmic adaptor subunit [Propionicimonas sp.]MBU3987621.1 HlyD family efflux transporter periplasmic adaptor subunit [Actinomycetota bacterium]MBU4007343.1 HlyD family efflux transporter periplasmic adaptor subunit [Actinomycetota bacterium]MBU4065711.1 HlyD family efflux transporter periplasmic a
MKPRINTGIAAISALAILAVTGCTNTTAPVSVVGTVVDPVRTVAMPSFSVASVNLDAGLPQTTTGAVTPNTTASTYQVGTTQLVSKVGVRQGDQVRAGQELLALDSSALKLAITTAKADQSVTEAQVDVLSAAITDTYDKAREVAANTTKVTDAIAKLTKTLADLKKAKPQLKLARADLASKLAAAENLLAHYPPVPPPGVPSKAELTAAIAKLKAGIAQLDAKLAQISKAIPQLTSGLVKARSGLAKLKSAAAKISDARQQLRNLRDLAEIAADSAPIPVALAEVQLKLATITAPVDGRVTWVAGVGDRLNSGAPVAKIAEAGNPKITAWLAPSQLAKVCLHDSAAVVGDWMPPGVGVPAKLTRISTTADFPPSSTTTEETHLTRAVQVELTAEASLPAGVPVVISISGCHPAAGQSEQDR